MKITKEISIRYFKGWNGAQDTVDVIVKTGKADQFDILIDDLYPDGIDETSLNDLLRFDNKWIFEKLKITKSYKVHVYNIKYDVDEDEEKELNLPKSMTIELEDVKVDENDEDLNDAIVQTIVAESGIVNSFIDVVDYDYIIIEEKYE